MNTLDDLRRTVALELAAAEYRLVVAEAAVAVWREAVARLNVDPVASATPARADRSTVRASKYDYSAIAAIARKAHAAGEPMGPAIRDALQVSDTMAAWLLRETRSKGHDVPAGSRNARRSSVPAAAPALVPVEASVADETPLEDELSLGELASSPGIEAVCDGLAAAIDKADETPLEAAPGAAAPATVEGWAPRVGDNVVTCPDCDVMYPAMSRWRLRDHIRTVHERDPERYELLPSEWTGER